MEPTHEELAENLLIAANVLSMLQYDLCYDPALGFKERLGELSNFAWEHLPTQFTIEFPAE